MYNNEERKEEVGAVLYDKPTIMDHMKDGAQPRKLRVILPPLDKNRRAIPHKVRARSPSWRNPKLNPNPKPNGRPTLFTLGHLVPLLGGCCKVSPNDPFGGLLAQLQADDVHEACAVLERKEPVFENGNYRLNFHGRVTVPSVKNFQLVQPNVSYKCTLCSPHWTPH